MQHTRLVALAVCISLGGTGLLVLAIYVTMKYRRRRKLLISQDTLPRPFEITVPAAARTSTWMKTRNLVSIPIPVVSPRPYRHQRNGWRDRGSGKEEASARLVPLRAGSISTSAMTPASQSQPTGWSGDTRSQSYPSNTPLLSDHPTPSSLHFPRRCRSHHHLPISPDVQSQSMQSGQLSSSLSISTRPGGAAGISASRSVHDRRCRTRCAVGLSRSASEPYGASNSTAHRRRPERGPLIGYTLPLDRHSELYFVRTDHLQQCSPATPMNAGPASLDSDAELGEVVIFQHQDAGVIQLPPPYHKLVTPD